MWLVVLGGVWTVATTVWSLWVQRRIFRLERVTSRLDQSDFEREMAENSTVVSRPPAELRFESLRPVPWDDWEDTA